MRRIKSLGSRESAKELWENRESLDKYIAKLKEYWDEENKCWLDEPKSESNTSSQTLTREEQEEKYYPGIEYQRLFNAISETKGIPTQDDMDEIIRIVHEDFPLEQDRYRIVVEEIYKEVRRAKTLFPVDFHNQHEGYAVILEEIDELWDEVKKNQKVYDLKAQRKEVVQCAAMCVRFAAELLNSITEPHNGASQQQPHSSTDDGQQNKTSNSEATILSAEQILGKYKPNNEYPMYYHENHIIAAMEEYKNQEVQLLNK